MTGATSDCAESMVEHYTRTRHTVTQGIHRPWTCEDCPARSALYDLQVPTKAEQAKHEADE